MEEKKISMEEMKETLARSGYFLESRVLSTLQKFEYSNTPNSTYPDSTTGKAREIDIYSESYRTTDNLTLNHDLHIEIQHRLVIECVNNSQPVVFFRRPDKSKYTVFGKFYFSKIDRKLIELKYGFDPDGEFHHYTTTSKKFHYNALKPNTQYCSFTPKKNKAQEWMASHPDALNDTFGKLFDYTLHLRKRYNDWMPTSIWKDGLFLVTFYPILVIQDDLYEGFEHNGTITIEKKKHIIFEYSKYSDEADSILIDVITENYLEEYLGIVKKDVNGLKSMYKKYYKEHKIAEPFKKVVASKPSEA